MLNLEFCLLAFTCSALLSGTWGILWARTSRIPVRASLGRWLFVGTLLSLGICGSVAAFHRAEGLVPMGLAAGLLLVGMLWEAPRSISSLDAAFPLPEEA